MKSIIKFIIALLILVSFSCDRLGIKSTEKQLLRLEVTTTQVNEDDLRVSKSILEKRLATYGLTNFEIVPNLEKMSLDIKLDENANTSEIVGLLTQKGKLEFCELYTKGELFELIGTESLDALLSSLKIEDRVGFDGNDDPVIANLTSDNFENFQTFLQSNKWTENLPSNLKFAGSSFEENDGSKSIFALRYSENQKPLLDGKSVEKAIGKFDKTSGTHSVLLDFDKEGTQLWAEATRNNLNKSVAIVLDGEVYAAPRVVGEINGGKAMITGNFSSNEINSLAALIGSGELPLDITLMSK